MKTAKITSVVLAILSISLLSKVLIPSYVKVAPGRVTLFDLSATYTEDPSILKSITLAYVPEGTYTLSASYVENMAKRKDLEVSFESSVITIYATSSLPKENQGSELNQEVLDLASTVFASITEENECLDSATFQVLQTSGSLDGTPTFEYKNLGMGKFSVLAKSGDRYLYMMMDVKCPKEVLITKKLLKFGDVIKPEFLEEATKDVFEILGTPASTSDAFYSKAMRMFKPGDVIVQEGIKRKPDVVKGQLLLAYVDLPGLHISTVVRSLQDAYVGEVVRAENISSGKIVMGVLEEGPVLKVMEVER